MKLPKSSPERRSSPRVWVYLPIEYQLKHAPRCFGGIVIDASETGFHIFSTENIPIGSKLEIEVLFPKKYELAKFEVLGEVVWKRVSVDLRGKGFQYGLKFVQILEEDRKKLRDVLSFPRISDHLPNRS